jgi:hypothetical protein
VTNPPDDAHSDQIEAGREAWQRIREHGRKSFEDWITVARALAIGRSACLEAAGCNRPFGSAYTRAAGLWLRQAGLDGMNDQERSRSLLVLKNLPAILEWRASVDEAQRDRFNHPNSVWINWRRSVRPIPTREPDSIPGHVVPRVTRHSKPKSIYWSQDAIKRAAVALRECYSNDTFVMARRALEAAIRCEADLLALLPDPPAKKPRQIAAPAALELQ